VWFYLIKAIAPFKLSAIYQPWRIDVANFLSCVPGLALLIVLGTALYFRRTWGRGVFFALAYAAVTLFPVLGFFPMAFAHLSLVADHWQYLSILGPIALLVGIIERSFGNNRIGKVRASTIACAALASLLLVGTWNRAAAYNGAESLWSATLAANPQAWGAHYNLGLVLAKKNQTDLAENHFRQALDIDPSFAEAHYNLGILLLSQGRIPEAISHLEKSANLKKDFSDAHYGLAVAYSRLNLTELAVKQLHETVRLRPDYAEAYYQLGVGLESQEKSEEAADSLTHAVALRPDYPEAQFLLGQILARQGRTGAAVEHYVSALRSKADFADAHTRLAACLAEQGKSEESLRHYLEAIRLNPRDLEAQNNAAWLLATHPDDHIRDGQKALELARSAVELAQGKVPTVLGTLAAAYAEAGRFAEAIQSAQVALRLAQKTADTATIHELKAQLLAYQQHKPYRQSPRT
jgi:tetratricopeptide (TPR) repeat protein